MKFPVEYGIVTNWDDFERILWCTYCNRLGAAASEHPALVCEPVCNPKANREKLTQIMFEFLNAPSVYLASEAVLSLYSTGAATGLVVYSGQSDTVATSVYEGHALPYTVKHLPYGGEDVTYCLQKLLSAQEKDFEGRSFTEISRNIKETLGYVALDFEAELDKASANRADLERKYELPDGRLFTVADERFRCAEIMFKPSLYMEERPGIHETAYFSVMRCDKDLRKVMFENILASGGNMLLPGMCERLAREVTNMMPPEESNSVEVKMPSAGKYSAWVGGSILANTSSFKNISISKEEYEEYGPRCAHWKCF